LADIAARQEAQDVARQEAQDVSRQEADRQEADRREADRVRANLRIEVRGTMAAGPTSLEEIDVGRHTARQISALVGRELGLPEPEKLTPAQVVVHGKEQTLRQSPDDVLSPPAKPGAGLVKLQLQEIAEALIAKRSATAAKKAAARREFEAARQGATHQEAAHQEAAHQEDARQEATRQEAAPKCTDGWRIFSCSKDGSGSGSGRGGGMKRRKINYHKKKSKRKISQKKTKTRKKKGKQTRRKKRR